MDIQIRHFLENYTNMDLGPIAKLMRYKDPTKEYMELDQLPNSTLRLPFSPIVGLVCLTTAYCLLTFCTPW